MPHAPEHKEIVDAVIDGELDAAELAASVAERGTTVAERLKLLARRIVNLSAAGKLSSKRARELWEEGWVQLHLLEFARVAGKVEKISSKSADRIRSASKKLGSDLTKVPAIAKADLKARDLERKGAVDDAGTLEP